MPQLIRGLARLRGRGVSTSTIVRPRQRRLTGGDPFCLGRVDLWPSAGRSQSFGDGVSAQRFEFMPVRVSARVEFCDSISELGTVDALFEYIG